MTEQSQAPTREGQNVIIKNLNNIFLGIVTILIGALYHWGQGLSEENATNKVVIQALRDDNRLMQAQIDDIESDVKDLQLKTELAHDDTKIRLTKIEDWIGFYTPKLPK